VTSRQEEELIFEHARVFDGINMVGQVSVIVKEGVIAAIGRDVHASGEATVLDASGMTLFPDSWMLTFTA
jgi:dihydroorotase-like cyclic amidohydrolase